MYAYILLGKTEYYIKYTASRGKAFENTIFARKYSQSLIRKVSINFRMHNPPQSRKKKEQKDYRRLFFRVVLILPACIIIYALHTHA